MHSAVHITDKIIRKTSQIVVTVARRLDDDNRPHWRFVSAI